MAEAYVQLKRNANLAKPLIKDKHQAFTTRQAIALLETEEYTDRIPFRPNGM